MRSLVRSLVSGVAARSLFSGVTERSLFSGVTERSLVSGFTVGVVLITFVAIQISIPAYAGSLSDYKNQKHAPSESSTQASKSNATPTIPCTEAYTIECQKQCSVGDTECRNECVNNAPAYCKQRAEKVAHETLILALVGVSLVLPAIATIFDQPRYIAEKDLNDKGDSYEVFWNYPSFYWDLGFGALEQGAKAFSTTAQFRYNFIGASGTFSFLFDNSTSLSEMDVGPTIYASSQHISAGIQPSLIGSAGTGTTTLWGYGLRSLNTFTLDRIYFKWDPLLGYINSQWMVHLRAGVGYRFTPSWGAGLAYELRSMINLNDLNVSVANLQGLFAYLTYRMN